MELTEKQIAAIETQFRNRCIAQNIKHNTKVFKTLQAEFFAGVMSGLYAIGVTNAILPKWTIGIMSGREIIKSYKLNQNDNRN